jgi:integrase
MSEIHSTPPNHVAKPEKPYPDFPLFPHANGQWAKKIRGKLHYFGLWGDPQGALEKYRREKDALHAGREPRPATDALTVKDLCNKFLGLKRHMMDIGEITVRTWHEYKAACDWLVSAFGKARLVCDLNPDDFARLRARIADRRGPVGLGNEIQRVRSVFKYAFDAMLVDTPVRFGPGFARPSKKVMRLNRARKGVRMFEAEEIRRMLDAAGTPLRAMILLGINAGLGNADVGTLPAAAVNLETGWVNFPRPKTGIGRRFPLWPETVSALREALAKRPEPKLEEHAGLLFVTKYGGSWHKSGETIDNPVSKEMRKLLDGLGIGGGRNFYALRHTFETVAGEAKDQPAVDHIMGHADESMAAVYRERVGDGRLRAVVEHFRAWLFPAAGGTAGDRG